MPSFFNRLNFTFGNEDWERTESRALKINPGDRVVCITASGDRPLHVLLENCAEVISVDANPLQNYLFELKQAAIQGFDFDEYLSFLGTTGKANRKAQLKKLSSLMSPEAVRYWEQNIKMINEGVLYQGLIEKITSRLCLLFKTVRGKKVNRLFSFQDVEEQKEFVKKHWDTFFYRKAFDVFSRSSNVIKFAFKDPVLYAHVDPTIKVGPYIYNKINNYLGSHLASESILLSLILQGKVNSAAYPPYLKPQGFAIMKPRLDRVKPVTANMITFLENAPKNSFDAFSLSDIASYMNVHDFTKLLHAVYRAAKPGARFSIRQITSNHIIPTVLQPGFVRNHSLEKQVENDDRCFLYRYMVGHIHK